MDTVTESQRQTILDIELQFWRTAGAKETAIRAAGLTVTRHYQLLNRLLDDPAAMAAEPQLLKRLCRIRARDRAVRPGHSG